MSKKEKVSFVVPSHTAEPTSDPDVFRWVDREGNWKGYKRKSTGRFYPAVNHILHTGFNKGPRFARWLLSVNPDEAKKVLNSAADRGSRVHKAIKDLIDGLQVSIGTKYPSDLQRGRQEPLTNEEWDFIRCFVRWQEAVKPEVAAQEKVVVSERYVYAGTVDFLGTVDVQRAKGESSKRIAVLLDHKTSSSIYNDQFLQVAAYFQAWKESNPNGFIPDHIGIVRYTPLRECGYEMRVFGQEKAEVYLSKFLAAKELYHLEEPEGTVPESEDIPTTFQISVPRWKAQREKKSKSKTKNNKHV